MHIDESALERLVSDAGLRTEELTEGDLLRFKAHLLGLPFIDLKKRKIDFATLSLIPEPVARKHNAVAYAKNDNLLEVALVSPEELPALNFLKKEGYKILPRLTDLESMKWALLSYQKTLKAEFGDTIQRESSTRTLADDPFRSARLTDTLVKHALLSQASFVHFDPLEDHLLVRYRIGPALHEAMMLPKHALAALAKRFRTLAGFSDTQASEGRFRIETEHESIPCRISFVATPLGEKILLRLVRGHAKGFTLENLGFGEAEVDRFHHILHGGEGLVIVAGPRRSGKTTTLYTLLDLINATHTSIASVEDPVETILPGITQTTAKPHLGISFAETLRTLLAHDHDVVMIEKVADRETAELAVRGAEHGKLILASLEAGTPQEAFGTLGGWGIEAPALTSVLKALVFQEPSFENPGRMTHAFLSV